MIKKAFIGVGVFAMSALAAVTIAFAQSPTSSPTMTTSPTEQTTVTPTPSSTVPSGAPSTGMGL